MCAARVLWLIKGLDRGGAERLVTSMAPRLDRKRYVIEVAYVTEKATGFVEQLAADGIDVTCLGGVRTVEAGWPRRLRRLLEERRYDLVHTHSPVPAVAARLLASRSTRFVHTEHNLWDSYRWPTYVANALTFSRNAAVLAVSEGVATSIRPPRWVPVGRQPPIESLLHGVDPDTAPRGPEARRRARAGLGLDEQTPVVGKVANLSEKKDHRGLLAAFDEVRRRVPGAQLLLIGSGPLRASLEAEVATRDLRSNVVFLGSREDVADLLPALDVFVLGSRFEGLPISLLEAMAAEVACVATSVGGIPEAITDGIEGRLVPPGEPGALADALTELLLDPARRAALATAGRERVTAQFSIDRAVQRTEELYAQLLGAGDPPATDHGGSRSGGPPGLDVDRTSNG